MRTIDAPGVEINEIDITSTTELPNGTTSLVVGFAKQGPTDELLNVTSHDEYEHIYGLPENAAERYMYDTAKQVLNANGNLLITRLPYGSGDGSGYSTKYSALVYPYIPVDVVDPCTTYAGSLSSATASNVGLYTFAESESGSDITSSSFSVIGAAVAANAICVSGVAAQDFTFTGTFYDSISGNIEATMVFNTDGSIVSGGDQVTEFANAYPVLSALDWTGLFTESSLTSSQIYIDENSPSNVYTATISANGTAGIVVSGTVTANIDYQAPASIGSVTTDGASQYFLGQPVHIAIDDATYFNWKQGGINWKQTITNDVSGLMSSDIDTILSNIGYGAMVVVNEAKTSITDKYEGYYVAIADNTKMDKGSNFDSISEIKSFNQYSEENEWISLNGSSLAFTLTGSFYQRVGSVSEIVESVPDFNFADTGSGGFADSLILTLFKVRPSIYNQNTRVLEDVLYESHIGSLDSTRKIQNETGGASRTFFLEDVVNTSSNNLKVFVNPYISTHSGTWFDQQTLLPKKTVRVVCGERDVLGSSTTDVIDTTPAEPQNMANTIFDAINAAHSNYCLPADSLYGVGEVMPCDATLQKYIGNVPRKLEKALHLAENSELLRIDLVPEGGLGTIWTGMNLDMNNWPAGTTTRTGTTRVKELYDDTVYINGILNAHTFDADSDGLLNQTNGSASEASDLYEEIAGIYNQFCQYTRKDCLYIADPLRHIFVQGNGDVKVLDDTTKNFSQHIFWPLKNLYGGLNSSYSCTYANWFKVSDTNSGRLVWSPPSGYMAKLMTDTDTNFYPWYAPAGLTRGIINGIVDIGVNPNPKQRGLLYKNGINPITYNPNDGYVVWGQKTLLSKPSAFNRINVRRLFLWCEKGVLRPARYFVMEQNTPFTRSRLKSAIDPILSFAQSNEGIYKYLIVCDERNNTNETIDRNEMIVDIYIQPVRVAEYILINFIATRTGQDFTELI